MDISIIVPLYHGNRYIDSIISQMERALAYGGYSAELIFVNDSPDTPVRFLPKVERFEIKVYEKDRNDGIHGARVFGYHKSSGKYIVFLDQDDSIQENYFCEQIKNILDADVSVCACINGDKRESLNERYISGQITLKGMISEGNYIRSPGQVLMKRNVIPSVWIENIMVKNGADDWFLWIAMLAEGRKISYIDRILYIHTLHESNASGDSMEMHDSEQELLRILKRNSILNNSELKVFTNLLKQQDRKCIAEGVISEKKASVFRRIYEVSRIRCIYEGVINQDEIIYIYGYGEMGRFLSSDLVRNKYVVKGFIDRDAAQFLSDEKIVKMGDEIGKCDVIIVSNLKGTDEIIENLQGVYASKIVSIYDLIGDTN